MSVYGTSVIQNGYISDYLHFSGLRVQYHSILVGDHHLPDCLSVVVVTQAPSL